MALAFIPKVAALENANQGHGQKDAQCVIELFVSVWRRAWLSPYFFCTELYKSNARPYLCKSAQVVYNEYECVKIPEYAISDRSAIYRHKADLALLSLRIYS